MRTIAMDGIFSEPSRLWKNRNEGGARNPMKWEEVELRRDLLQLKKLMYCQWFVHMLINECASQLFFQELHLLDVMGKMQREPQLNKNIRTRLSVPFIVFRRSVIALIIPLSRGNGELEPLAKMKLSW